MKATSLSSLANRMGISCDSTKPVKGVCVDSRLLNPGDLFFALPGAQSDGHQYLQEVASKDAVGAVVHKNYRGENFGLPLLFVEDTLSSLQTLAQITLEQSRSKIVAVTGSVGKTTTKDFITTLLRAKYQVSSSPGNSNSQIGLPLAILNHATGDEEVLVLEMGMTHSGQLSRLIQIAPPDIALITSVALVHAVNFDSLEQIACAKAEIFSHPKTKLGIFNYEICNKKTIEQIGECQKQTFSLTTPEAHYFLARKEKGLQIQGMRETKEFLPLSIPGEHNHHNFLAAVAVARALNVSWEEIQAQQSFLTLPERRLQFIEKKGVLFVNDSYNASELSIKAALQSMPEPKQGRKKIAVIGGILELGKFSQQCHEEVGKFALDCVDSMLCMGTECAPIYDCWMNAKRPVVWTAERSEIISHLRNHVQSGDVVLLKGSRAKQFWKIVEEL